MSNEADRLADEAYEKAIEAIDVVLEDANATPEQVDEAQAKLASVTAAHNAYVADRISRRTAFLDTLRNELEAVIASVRGHPIGDALNKANTALSIVNDAAARFGGGQGH